jgi:CheY-like chemotaxis protein
VSSPRQILVLLVDDEPGVRLVASDGLEDAGFAVIEAADAREAINILASRPDVGVLFTDVNMPGELDGLELAELVHQRWPAIKLVVTSGRALPREVPDDGRFIAKPYSLRSMTKLIGEVGERKSAQTATKLSVPQNIFAINRRPQLIRGTQHDPLEQMAAGRAMAQTNVGGERGPSSRSPSRP